MTNYSERSLHLAEQLRQQALRNLGKAKSAETEQGRGKQSDSRKRTREQ